MDIQTLYSVIGGNADTVIELFRREDRIKKYLVKTAQDPSFERLAVAMAAKDWEDAFKAVHTVKGMCLNLQLGKLTDQTIALVECLRGGNPDEDEAAQLYKAMRTTYEDFAAAAEALD